MAVARINVPKTAQRGDLIEIRTLISHSMETGYRRDYLGKTLPRAVKLVEVQNGKVPTSVLLGLGAALVTTNNH